VKVLGLDVSTSNVGFCLLDTECSQSNGVLLAYGIPLGKIKGLYAKSCVIRSSIQEIAKDYCVDVVVVEEPLQAFRSRMSSAHTIAKLNRFNGIVSFIARSEINCPVQMGNVISVRKSVGIKLEKKSDKNTKEQILEWVAARKEMKNFEWPTKKLKSGPNAGTIRHEDYCYDIADAFVVALWGSMFLKIEDLDDTIL